MDVCLCCSVGVGVGAVRRLSFFMRLLSFQPAPLCNEARSQRDDLACLLIIKSQALHPTTTPIRSQCLRACLMHRMLLMTIFLKITSLINRSNQSANSISTINRKDLEHQ